MHILIHIHLHILMVQEIKALFRTKKQSTSKDAYEYVQVIIMVQHLHNINKFIITNQCFLVGTSQSST